MKIRIISSVVALAIGICVLMGIFTPVFPIFIAVLSVIAANEIMKVVGVKSNFIILPASIFSAIIPMYMYVSVTGKLKYNIPVDAVLALYCIMMLSFMLKTHKKTKFEQLAITLYASIFIPYAFSCVIMLSRVHNTYAGVYTSSESIYLVFFSLFCALLTDTFAYFVGRKFGKHKMAPIVSPKKSVEGAIGGFVLSVAFNVAVFAGVKQWIFHGETAIDFVFIIVMSAILSGVSMLGDLTASLLKRNYGIKDFGKIMPGHGGIMDRFDSCVFVWPVLMAGIKFLNM